MERRALSLGVNLATRPGSTFAQIRATMLSPGVPWVFVLRRWVKGVTWRSWEAWNCFRSNNWNRTLSERSLSDIHATIARLNDPWCENVRKDIVWPKVPHRL